MFDDVMMREDYVLDLKSLSEKAIFELKAEFELLQKSCDIELHNREILSILNENSHNLDDYIDISADENLFNYEEKREENLQDRLNSAFDIYSQEELANSFYSIMGSVIRV